MTTVYGVTAYGVWAQINEELENIGGLNHQQYKDGKKYLCDKVFLALRKMFSSAKQIQVSIRDMYSAILL